MGVVLEEEDSEEVDQKKMEEKREAEKMKEKQRVLLGATGSVASIKVGKIVELLKEEGFEVKVVATKYALHFIDTKELGETPLLTDEEEWSGWKKLSDPVLHIELRRWADLFLVAPLDANTLAKISSGMCDNLLTCVARCWDFSKPMLVSPAMNTMMWLHPLTQPQLDTLTKFGAHVLDPVSKKLACNDVGMGALPPPEAIVEQVKKLLSK